MEINVVLETWKRWKSSLGTIPNGNYSLHCISSKSSRKEYEHERKLFNLAEDQKKKNVGFKFS